METKILVQFLKKLKKKSKCSTCKKHWCTGDCPLVVEMFSPYTNRIYLKYQRERKK